MSTVAGVIPLAPCVALSQTDYPSRPLRLVVTVPPAGAADFAGIEAK